MRRLPVRTACLAAALLLTAGAGAPVPRAAARDLPDRYVVSREAGVPPEGITVAPDNTL